MRQGLELLLPRLGFRMIGSAGSAREGARQWRHALVLKTSPIERVADAICAAADGHTYVDSTVARVMGRRTGPSARKTSKREGQVLGLLARGRTTEQIAADLFLSPETIQTHVRTATRKLGARGRLHAVMLALVNGEIALPENGALTAQR